jgi:hypothetical protein
MSRPRLTPAQRDFAFNLFLATLFIRTSIDERAFEVWVSANQQRLHSEFYLTDEARTFHDEVTRGLDKVENRCGIWLRQQFILCRVPA